MIVMSPRPFDSQDLTTHETNTSREGLSLVPNVLMVDKVETLSTLCTLNSPFKQRDKHDNGVWFIKILPWKLINFCAHSHGMVLRSWWWDASVMHLTKSCVLFGCEEFRFSKTACRLPAGPRIRLVVVLHRRTNVSSWLSLMSSPSQGSMPYSNFPFWLEETQCTTTK